jgi:hypothetical protein
MIGADHPQREEIVKSKRAVGAGKKKTAEAMLRSAVARAAANTRDGAISCRRWLST